MDIELLDEMPQEEQEQEFKYASLGSRFGASILDGIIVGVPVIVLQFLNIFVLKTVFVPFLALFFYPFYKIYMEGNYGYTLGKKILGFKIIRLDDYTSKMDIRTASIRYIFGFPSLLLSIVITASTLSGDALRMVNDLESFIAHNDLIRVNTPQLLTTFNALVSIAWLVAVCFIFEGTKRQTLYDRIAKTACVVDK